MSPAARRLLVAADASARLEAAADWLRALPRDAEVAVVGASQHACDEIVRRLVRERGSAFGTERATLDRLASRLALPALAARGLAPATHLTLVAVAARSAHIARAAGRLDRLAEVSQRPGFAVALARTLAELRMNGVAPAAIAALGSPADELAALATSLDGELEACALADRACIYTLALEAARPPGRAFPLGLPLLFLDLRLTTTHERELVATLSQRSPAVLATVPAGDRRTQALLADVLAPRLAEDPVAAGRDAGAHAPASAATSLVKLKSHLFATTAPERAPLDATVSVSSWPGVTRECVEIARTLQIEAAGGLPFDRMAIALHAPGEYAARLEEALDRAGIPAFFARGARRPHPAGRALLALLACAAERLSARRFAEYLSLSQVPVAGAPPRFTPPEDDLLPLARDPDEPVGGDLATAPFTGTGASRSDGDAAILGDTGTDPDLDSDLQDDPAAAPSLAGSIATPWRWERLLVDAAVIGGRTRWERRLDGLEAELRLQHGTAPEEDEPRRLALERRLADLTRLRAFALPLLDRLAALPDQAAWGEWLAHLNELARAALREPEPVLAALAELEPSAPVGPVTLDEVRIVLAPRLRELTLAPPRRRYGAVYVTTPEGLRGLRFDVVAVPGLAERTFPAKLSDDPLLSDALRARLGAPSLTTRAMRIEAERLALELAVGAAQRRVLLSYPRIDVEQGRPRVPSFYLLEVLRAAEGALPRIDEIGRRTHAEGASRLGWPAPERPAQAIDEAEYDLALLAPLVGQDEERVAGTARYLMDANPHLARALRARWRRWSSAWTSADGLVSPDEEARAALARHQVAARSFSPTALQALAACPYRFFLQAILRLSPPEEAVAIEVLDPLTRGAMFHDAQFGALTALRDEGLLPLRPESLERARGLANVALDAVADREFERLAPAIPRVWDDAIARLRADLHEWLRRHAELPDGWVPAHFELSFGIVDRDRRYADPTSVATPVPIAGGLQLRGSIDLVERDARGRVRATDHKTGRIPKHVKEDVVIGGGEVLQPVLYALACETLIQAPVAEGRLYYCTADGGYEERRVALDEDARRAAGRLAQVVADSLSKGFLPAAPREGACRFCDYRAVCGPHEEIRVKRKRAEGLGDIARLRQQR